MGRVGRVWKRELLVIHSDQILGVVRDFYQSIAKLSPPPPSGGGDDGEEVLDS